MDAREFDKAPSLWTHLRKASKCVQTSLAAQTCGIRVGQILSGRLGDAGFQVKQIFLSLW